MQLKMTSFKERSCGFSPQLVDCVLLDDGGFLLMSNQDEYITLVSYCNVKQSPSLIRAVLICQETYYVPDAVMLSHGVCMFIVPCLFFTS